jgi:phage I-like protein
MRKEEADKLSAYWCSNEWTEKIRDILDKEDFNNKTPLFSYDSNRVELLELKVEELLARVSHLEKLLNKKV